ncbi:extracellular solute-binding protein [Vallitalea pronyensis]|uniref:Extracellular solute-binding protein n=1 Tax=Vallitalea pronyensis TaxID=1348613 RepID=A0A8J8MML9_9FIRM|nr:extracellular solute-binding protein [Vallitalea pronyensis]QUI24048.1 extracellular solute-binding protein [Vallitalea pronyensis]
MRIKRGQFVLTGLIIMMMTLMMIGCGKASEEKDSKSASSQQTNNGNDTNEKETGKKNASGKITDEPVTLTMWSDFNSTNIPNLADNIVYKELEKRTGVTVEFTHPPAGESKQAFNLLLASGDLPDMMENIPPEFPGGPDKAIKDGYFLKLNDYIDEYAPNYKEKMNYNEEIRRQTMTDEGNIWSFSCIQLDQEPPWSGMLIREDWLNDLGLKVPETIEEWENMLIAFKEEKGAEGPLMISFDWKYASNSAFASAYGSSVLDNNLDFMNKDGEVIYGPAEPGYKDYLQLLARWYEKGLLDPDFATRDNKSFDAYFTSGKAGAFSNGYGAVTKYVTAGKENDPDFSIVAAPMPVVNKGDKVHIRQSNPYVRNYYRVISAKTEYPEIAVQWMDYAYSDEGFLLYNYGIEGDTYEIVNEEPTFGKTFLPPSLQHITPTFTDKMLNNPNGDFWSIYDQYKIHVSGNLRNPLSYELDESVLDAMEIWMEAGDDWVMPPVIMTDDETREFTSIMSEVETYAKEMSFKIIMGLEPVDKFDEYMRTLEALGINQAISIQQAALERYLNR